MRSDPIVDYVVDILEPHGQQYTDNLPKAKALAEYVKKEDRLGRIQLIRRTTDAGGSRFIRLDLTDIIVQDKVLRVNNDDDLNSIFTLYGIISYSTWHSGSHCSRRNAPGSVPGFAVPRRPRLSDRDECTPQSA